MVCQRLLQSDDWQKLTDNSKGIVFTASLLHDIGKLSTARMVDNQLTSRGHSQRRPALTRLILWQRNVPFVVPEHIVNLIRHHQVPFWIFERNNTDALAMKISQTTSCYLLCLLSKADAKGRIAPDVDDTVNNVKLFSKLARSLDCHHAPASFASFFGRLLIFNDRWQLPAHAPYGDFKCEMIIISGLPGSEKDHWIKQQTPHLPVVSLDALRRTEGIGPTDNQGQIIQMAKAEAKSHLARYQPLVWNATNLTFDNRRSHGELALRNNTKPTIVYVEVPCGRLGHQNAHRQHAAPENVLKKIIENRWDVPAPFEAADVTHVVQSPEI
ncbi:MAG: AAA family ATPase [Deltaproteobacteria bacterium]|nr:AAA family ATPase [Deltaproteobacteria bacterium]